MLGGTFQAGYYRVISGTRLRLNAPDGESTPPKSSAILTIQSRNAQRGFVDALGLRGGCQATSKDWSQLGSGSRSETVGFLPVMRT
jgi:hypothetical protein